MNLKKCLHAVPGKPCFNQPGNVQVLYGFKGKPDLRIVDGHWPWVQSVEGLFAVTVWGLRLAA